MEDKNEMDKVDDVMLPGFRFHPTDEELVGFYLKRKVQQQTLPIELINQVDIYKYDPWDLPKLASTGEKEWYFYCLRDRKYRNSARPNRVTGAGFWKATGTDRPIYSSDGTKFIGLKKSLVFYRGRAAKGFKTDWMMHEFRLPSLPHSSTLNNKPSLPKSFPTHDSWAICRIFKKTNSMAHRALSSHSWMCPLPEISNSEMFSHSTQWSQFSPENMSCTTELSSALRFCCDNSPNTEQQQQQASMSNLSYVKPTLFPFSSDEIKDGLVFSSLEESGITKPCADGCSNIGSLSTNNACETAVFDGFSMSQTQNVQEDMDREEEEEDDLASLKKNSGANHVNNSRWGVTRSLGFPFSLPEDDNAWKPNMPWDSPSCPNQMSISYSTHKCYNN